MAVAETRKVKEERKSVSPTPTASSESVTVKADAFLERVKVKIESEAGKTKAAGNYDGFIDQKVKDTSAADIILGIKAEKPKALPKAESPEKSKETKRLKNTPVEVADNKKKSSNDTDDDNDEDLPEGVKSFLDVMNELDKKNNIRPKARRSDRSQPPEQQVSKEKSKKASRSDRDRSSHRHSKSSSSSGSTGSKKHADSSRHKKSSASAAKPPCALTAKQIDANKEMESKSNDDSPLPDFSEELDLLPDDLGELVEAEKEEHGDDDDIFEDEDDELRRIFDEYRPAEAGSSSAPGDDASSQRKAQKLAEAAKAREQEDSGGGGSASTSKKRVAHNGASDRKASSKHGPPAPKARKLTPHQMLMQRYKSLQAKQNEDDDLETQLTAITEGSEAAAAAASAAKKRVAHGFNLTTYNPDRAKSKLQRQLDARREATESNPGERTVGHTLKGMPRLAHTPTAKAVKRLEKPIIASDPKAKVPANVRQRYLDSIVEECLRIYKADKSKAYERAVKEEESCYGRSKNRNIYLNVVVNAIKKLRGETAVSTPAAGSAASTSTAQAAGKRNMLTTHMQVLAGKAGTVGTWSIEKPKRDAAEITPDLTYTILKRYVLTDEQLVENCYPMPDPNEKGKVVVKEDPWRPRKPQPTAPDMRACDRCLKVYKVDKTGRQLAPEECVYHWGRLYKKRGNRGETFVRYLYYYPFPWTAWRNAKQKTKAQTGMHTSAEALSRIPTPQMSYWVVTLWWQAVPFSCFQ